jgi:ribosomal protein S18 acetylase RimI-like enzyme
MRQTSLATQLQSASGLDAAVSLQARAFFDDPLFEWVFQDEADRRTRLPWLMSVGLNVGLRSGEVHTTSGPMLGHAVWLPPGDTHVDDERLASAGFVDADRQMGAASLARFGSFMEQVGQHHQQLVPEPHWYLMILGVDPPFQGQGVGGVLLQPVLARADREARRCYLETTKERNLAFYRRHGFDVVREDVPDESGPRVWLMVRVPR